MIKNEAIKNVLIPINTGLGNSVLVFPLIRTIKSVLKNAKIDLYGKNSFGANETFNQDPDILNIYSEIPIKKYDLILSPFLGGSVKFGLKMRLKNWGATIIVHRKNQTGISNIIKVLILKCLKIKTVEINENKHESWNYLSLLEPLGINTSSYIYNNYFSKELVSTANNEFKQSGVDKKYIAIQLGVANNLTDPRFWPVKNWESIISDLIKNGNRVLLLGDKNEKKLGEKIESNNNSSMIINLIGKTTVIQMIGFLNNAELTIGVDSGIAHISGALNKNTLVLWGPSIFSKSHPLGKNVNYINLNMPCAPCMGPSLYSPKEAVENCNDNLACMNQITPEKVMMEVKRILSNDK